MTLTGRWNRAKELLKIGIEDRDDFFYELAIDHYEKYKNAGGKRVHEDLEYALEGRKRLREAKRYAEEKAKREAETKAILEAPETEIQAPCKPLRAMNK